MTRGLGFFFTFGLALASAAARAELATLPPPEPFKPTLPPPAFRPADVRTNESPVAVSDAWEVVADNGIVRRVAANLVFTNPNARAMGGELEFALPDGAAVCSYALEVNGVMTPGVVCEKEKARVAFENERRRGVDPGVVEHVKGNVWRTRVYPLMPGAPRRARVEYIETLPKPTSHLVLETCNGELFCGEAKADDEPDAPTRAERLKKATSATICWDASMSRQGGVASDRAILANLPERGDFTLVVFRNVVEAPRAFATRDELLAAIDALVYDGATCLEEVQRKMAHERNAFLFTDEFDVDAEARRRVRVFKVTAPRTQLPCCRPPVVTNSLLATAWAADYVARHADEAELRRDEFVRLGRLYGVASPVTSMLVLETVEQYLRHDVEPPKASAFYREWRQRHEKEDGEIAAKMRQSDHETRLLRLWDERVKWWNDPVPKDVTPSSGLFLNEDAAAAESLETMANAMPVRTAADADLRSPVVMRTISGSRAPGATLRAKAASAAATRQEATIRIAAWDPKTPYLAAIRAAKPGEAYAEYLRQRDAYGKAPAFYFDCADAFFKAKEPALAVRILSNLAELRVLDAALLRTMGWRLREARACDEAVEAFRQVLKLRGEEPQARRDLALVLTERGKQNLTKAPIAAEKDLGEALTLLHEAAFKPAARRSGWRGNDMQTSVLALEELNGLVSWIEAQVAKRLLPADWAKAAIPQMDAAYRRDLPLALRVTLSWDVDETDVDLHVLEPDGEEAFYRHRRTRTGGFLSEDVTTGYGPEEYLRKTCEPGVYKILANYFASHQQSLTGAATVTATVYTDWATANENREVFSFRLDKPKAKHAVGEVTIR